MEKLESQKEFLSKNARTYSRFGIEFGAKLVA